MYGSLGGSSSLSTSQGLVIDRDSSGAAATRQLVIGWHAENPVATGVGWSCALEPAFRALSWLWGYFLTLDDPEFDADSHVQWLEAFHDHGRFLHRHLEDDASPFNHLIGEACALYCLGVLFPEFREARMWRVRARHALESELPREFYSDGGSAEQSTFYHHATTGFYLLAVLLARENGKEFSDAVWAAIERAIEFSTFLQQPDGTTPRIGGADDGNRFGSNKTALGLPAIPGNWSSDVRPIGFQGSRGPLLRGCSLATWHLGCATVRRPER